jgi:UPF0755 protein
MMIKKILQNSLIAFISIIFLYIATVFSLIMYFNAPNSYHQTDKRFVVDSGMTFRQVVERLYKEKIIKSPSAFLYISQLIKGVDPRVRYGEYFFEKNTSYYKILHKMLRGYIYFRKVTISEGLSINTAKKIIEKSPGLIGQLPEGLKDGTILPETYFYSYNDTKSSMVKRMQNALDKNLEELWQKRDLSIPIKTKEKALILASIVEKETGMASERPQVASVFINRLKKGMKLQSDPTIIYSFAFGDKALERPIRVSDIQNNSHYNTYNIYGLPPSPICNPGLASIKAVLNPINSNYLYFVATGKGDHHFSSSIEEHNNYVAKYRAIMRNKEQQKTINAPANSNIGTPQINDSSKINQNVENKPTNHIIDNQPNIPKQEAVSSENNSNI